MKIDKKEGRYVVEKGMKRVVGEVRVMIENVGKGREMSGKGLDGGWCVLGREKNSDGE